jgi:hypothetical protein
MYAEKSKSAKNDWNIPLQSKMKRRFIGCQVRPVHETKDFLRLTEQK